MHLIDLDLFLILLLIINNYYVIIINNYVRVTILL